VGSAGAYVLNRYAFSNDLTPSNWFKKVGIIFLSQYAGEYIADYAIGSPVSYFV
jgi:hypothetical protein